MFDKILNPMVAAFRTKVRSGMGEYDMVGLRDDDPQWKIGLFKFDCKQWLYLYDSRWVATLTDCQRAIM